MLTYSGKNLSTNAPMLPQHPKDAAEAAKAVARPAGWPEVQGTCLILLVLHFLPEPHACCYFVRPHGYKVLDT